MTGRTTKQMQSAPKGAVYIWIDNDFHYPLRLARDIGRMDLEIVSPGWLLAHSWVGRVFSGVIVDHAVRLSAPQIEILEQVLTRVRPAYPSLHIHTPDKVGHCVCGWNAPGSKAAADKVNRDNAASYREQQKAAGKVYLQRWVTPEQRDDIDAYLGSK